MANFRALSSKIKSVKSIQKTTRVMQMISASKFRSSRASLACSREYYESLPSGLGISLPRRDETDVVPDGELLVVLSSDRGLCGGFNYAIAKALLKHLESVSDGKAPKLLFLGKKVYDIARRSLRSTENVLGVIAQPRLSGFLDFKSFLYGLGINFTVFQKVSILHSKFHNISFQEQVIEDVLVNIIEEDVCKEGAEREVEEPMCVYDPHIEGINRKMWFSRFLARFHLAMLESLTSEHCCRMIAMESANTNTNSMLEKLVLSYNRSRQAAITTDLIEVISGCEALS